MTRSEDRQATTQRVAPTPGGVAGPEVTTYFKATRCDGLDFATGTVLYEVGKTTPRIEGRLEICKRGYHVSDAPAETLVGGTWPCRLFEVEAIGLARKQSFTAAHPHKGVCREVRVLRELPAWQALGSNGEAVAALIERCKTLTSDEIARLSAAWVAARGAAWVAARDADAAWGAAWDAARVAAWFAARDAAWGAAWDAAGALVVRDLITPKQFDVLYGPWASVMEEKG